MTVGSLEAWEPGRQWQRRERLDQALVARGLALSRAQARDLIKRGAVSVDGVATVKPAAPVGYDATLELADLSGRYVSRGALKLQAALAAFGFPVAGRHCLDVGSSTGGFTHVLLDAGATHVTAIDVGHGQLHPMIRDDPRVTAHEGLDARALGPAHLAHVTLPVEAIVADVSFISLRLALPVPMALARPGAWLIALIKPQFELTPDAIGKGGLVRNAALREDAVERVRGWLAAQPLWRIEGLIPSPITGKGGNHEYLIGLTRHG